MAAIMPLFLAAYLPFKRTFTSNNDYLPAIYKKLKELSLVKKRLQDCAMQRSAGQFVYPLSCLYGFIPGPKLEQNPFLAVTFLHNKLATIEKEIMLSRAHLKMDTPPLLQAYHECQEIRTLIRSSGLGTQIAQKMLIPLIRKAEGLSNTFENQNKKLSPQQKQQMNERFLASIEEQLVHLNWLLTYSEKIPEITQFYYYLGLLNNAPYTGKGI